MNRIVPLSARISIVLGAGMTKMGFLLIGFLGIFAWTFGGNADLTGLHFMFGETVVAKGEVLESVETNFEVNERSVYATVYRFESEGGGEYIADAFSTGAGPQTGASVRVEYVRGAAQHSRIPGMRSAEFSGWLALMALLPLIGAGLCVVGVRRGLKHLHILRSGVLTSGKLIAKTATNVQINDQTVYELEFEFTSQDGKVHRMTVKTHQPESLEDDEEEALIYLPGEEDEATTLDNLPGEPVVTSSRVETNRGAFSAALVPIVCLGPHLVYMFM